MKERMRYIGEWRLSEAGSKGRDRVRILLSQRQNHEPRNVLLGVRIIRAHVVGLGGLSYAFDRSFVRM